MLNFFKKTGEEKDKKKQIENIVVFIIILIITVLIINTMWSSSDKKENKKNNDTSSKTLASVNVTEATKQDDLEDRLENILQSINGVGKVKVLLKYSESSTVVAMYNETSSESSTEENDKDGSRKNVMESESKKEIVYSDENKPITEKVIMPVIEGAIITAEGAANGNIKSSIVSAVEAITGLAVHKIQVFEMGV